MTSNKAIALCMATGLAAITVGCAEESTPRRPTSTAVSDPNVQGRMAPDRGVDSRVLEERRMMEERRARQILTDANVLAIIEAANRNTIQESKLAQQRASNPDVRLYANRLQQDHELMLQQGNNVASRMNQKPILPPGERDLTIGAESDLEALKHKFGEDFDQAFLAQRIRMSEKVLSKLNDSGYEAENPDVRTFVSQAKPGIQAHLKSARDLQRTMANKSLDGDRDRILGGDRDRIPSGDRDMSGMR
jgi:putative membrane protein